MSDDAERAPHSHAHAHDEHAHSRSLRPDADRRYLLIALALLLGFMLFEVVLGFLASSLALISDAGHMLTDVGALAMALVAMRLAASPATGRRTFGLKRAEILSAQINGITLLVLAALFVFEAIQRLITPPRVEGGLVFVVALVGIAVNLAATWALAHANRRSLNAEGSFQHILTDLYAFIATAVAGALIYFTGFTRFDALATLVVATLMARAGFSLVRASWRILLETAPEGVEPARIAQALMQEPGVEGAHDLHLWEVTSGFPVLSAHIDISERLGVEQRNALLGRLTRLLDERFGIHHTTIQLECALCDADGLFCALEPADQTPQGAARQTSSETAPHV